MKSKKIIIGSRGSKLALIYAKIAKKKIIEANNNFNEEDIIIKNISTRGDEVQDMRLSDVGGKGLFSKKIEDKLLENEIHIAVHALKDMPSNETSGLITECFLKRNDPREILISRENLSFNELPSKSIVGTSSFRREFQLKKKRKDLNYKLIRGNVDTRLNKLKEKLYDAIILSYAGIQSLGLDKNITEVFSTSEIIPSACQGVIALQCRKEDKETINLIKKTNHLPTYHCVQAERGVLKALEGDCETAVGAFAQIVKDKINIEAELFSLDGNKRFHFKSSKNLNLASQLGKEVGEVLKKKSNNSYKK